MYLDVFKEDPQFAAHEAEYAAIRREILGEEEEEEVGDGGCSSCCGRVWVGGGWVAGWLWRGVVWEGALAAVEVLGEDY